MDFSFSDEQRALEESMQRLLAREYGFERRRAIERSAEGWSRETWRALADLGVLGINVPEEYGGLGQGALETLIVMNLFGRALLLEPFLPSAVTASLLLQELASPEQRAAWLPSLAQGERIASLAHFEPGARYDSRHVETRAQPRSGGYLLQGRKGLVEHAEAADVLLVSARGSGEASAPRGVSLFLVPRDAPGVRLHGYRMLDGRRAADVTLESVGVASAVRLGGEGDALAAIERSLDFALAALCAEAVGCMQALLDATVAYLKTRQQFGRPIGSFQALQHRAADMLLELEQARSMSYLAAMRCTARDEHERRRVMSAAKATINRAARFVSQQAVQLHGGMGMTDELQVSHWFKRLACIEMTLGDTDTHVARFAALARGEARSD